MDGNSMHPKGNGDHVPATGKPMSGEVEYFGDLAAFSQAAQEATGVTFDFSSIAALQTSFVGQLGDAYLVVNVKDGDTDEEPNNLLLLGERKSLLFSRKPPQHEAHKTFEKVLARPYGRSTVLAFLTLSRVLTSYKQRLESLTGSIRGLEQKFDSKSYRELAFEFERLDDQLEDFHDVLLKLQEREYWQVETRHISFDYSVLIAESLSLQGRYRRRMAVLSELARVNEMRTSTELNIRIERLNDVMKRLTALTIILMFPTLVASHFGMNFVNMPELHVPWAYTAVIISQAVLLAAGLVLFRKIGWL